MAMFKVLLLLPLLVTTVESDWLSGSKGSGNYNYELSGQGLTDLYNSRVKQVEVVTRPLSPLLGALGLQHSGVRATLYDGSQWLVHKGYRYGLSGGDTVVTRADDMSDQWTAKGPIDIGGSKTIGDLVRDGGAEYQLIGQNCHDARKAMMRP